MKTRKHEDFYYVISYSLATSSRLLHIYLFPYSVFSEPWSLLRQSSIHYFPFSLTHPLWALVNHSLHLPTPPPHFIAPRGLLSNISLVTPFRSCNTFGFLSSFLRLIDSTKFSELTAIGNAEWSENLCLSNGLYTKHLFMKFDTAGLYENLSIHFSLNNYRNILTTTSHEDLRVVLGVEAFHSLRMRTLYHALDQ